MLSHTNETTLLRTSLEEEVERRVDEIEMIGEEEAAGSRRQGVSEITPGMRYLHVSQTIHQLITDRNRAAGLFITVASLLFTATAAILNARPTGKLIISIETIQRWALLVTCGSLTVLSLLTGLLLIRTRIRLLYEVAKMNALLGLPTGRVSRISPLSLFFLKQVLVSVSGGGFATLLSYPMFELYDPEATGHMLFAPPIGLCVTGGLITLYMVTVIRTTADAKLQAAAKP